MHSVMIRCRHLFRSLAPAQHSHIFNPLPRYFHSQEEQAVSQIGSPLDTTDETLRQNGESITEMVTRLDSVLHRIREGGGEDAKKKHVARGKLLPRDRISLLLDPGSNFLELSPLAGECLIIQTIIILTDTLQARVCLGVSISVQDLTVPSCNVELLVGCTILEVDFYALCL